MGLKRLQTYHKPPTGHEKVTIVILSHPLGFRKSSWCLADFGVPSIEKGFENSLDHGILGSNVIEREVLHFSDRVVPGFSCAALDFEGTKVQGTPGEIDEVAILPVEASI